MLQCSGLTESLGSQAGHIPAGTASLPRSVICPAVLCCFQFLAAGLARCGMDVPEV